MSDATTSLGQLLQRRFLSSRGVVSAWLHRRRRMLTLSYDHDNSEWYVHIKRAWGPGKCLGRINFHGPDQNIAKAAFQAFLDRFAKPQKIEQWFLYLHEENIRKHYAIEYRVLAAAMPFVWADTHKALVRLTREAQDEEEFMILAALEAPDAEEQGT